MSSTTIVNKSIMITTQYLMFFMCCTLKITFNSIYFRSYINSAYQLMDNYLPNSINNKNLSSTK